MRPEYSVLLQKVREAQRQNKHKDFSETEREIITLILSYLREGIVQEKFYRKRRCGWPAQLLVMKCETTHTYLEIKYLGYSIIKAIKHNSAVNSLVITNFLEQLDLKIKENYSKEIEVFFEFKSEEETL